MLISSTCVLPRGQPAHGPCGALLLSVCLHTLQAPATPILSTKHPTEVLAQSEGRCELNIFTTCSYHLQGRQTQHPCTDLLDLPLVTLLSPHQDSPGTTFSQQKTCKKAKPYFAGLHHCWLRELEEVRSPSRAEVADMQGTAAEWVCHCRNFLGRFVRDRNPSRNLSSSSPCNQQWRRDLSLWTRHPPVAGMTDQLSQR